jgi:hypothetical protein
VPVRAHWRKQPKHLKKQPKFKAALGHQLSLLMRRRRLVTQTTEKMLADHDAQLKEVVRAQVRMQQDFYNLTDMVTKLAEQVLSYSRLLNAMERRR